MSTWRSSNTTITEQGEYLFSKGIAENKITITRIVAGSGRVNEDVLKEQTEVNNPVVEGTISRVTFDNSGCTIVIAISNEEITSPYYLNQIGIYAKTENTSEILYMIAQADDPDLIPLYSETPINMTYNVYIAHSNELTISFEKPATGLVTFEDVKPLIDEIGDTLEGHISTSVFQNEEGVHGLRTQNNDSVLQLYNEATQNWENVNTYNRPISETLKIF